MRLIQTVWLLVSNVAGTIFRGLVIADISRPYSYIGTVKSSVILGQRVRKHFPILQRHLDAASVTATGAYL